MFEATGAQFAVQIQLRDAVIVVLAALAAIAVNQLRRTGNWRTQVHLTKHRIKLLILQAWRQGPVVVEADIGPVLPQRRKRAQVGKTGFTQLQAAVEYVGILIR